ncbi:A-kinase anchor protein 7 isoforms alpha and beta [Trebouxia sp. C0009 RCD-2024]
MSTGANQDELPSDAALPSWAEPPNNKANTHVPRSQSTKGARSFQQQPRRPNHFFALQVSQSATVTAAIRSVHDSLVRHSQALQPALVEPETAHLTLMVTALDTVEEVLRAEAAMETFAGELAADEAWAEPMTLSLEGLSHFRHQVLYLDVKKDLEHERLLAFAKALRDHMQASEIKSTDDRDFTGHVTIAKLSKIRSKRRKAGAKLSKIPEEGYAQQASITAGEVLVTELQLCQMQGRESGSYYKIRKSFAVCCQGKQ